MKYLREGIQSMNLTILHIEDDQEIGTWVSGFLKERGYEVIWITSGNDAMKHMERADLVILDIMLPGLDGYTIGQRLKQNYPNTPILLLSARTSMEDKLQGLKSLPGRCISSQILRVIDILFASC